MTIMPGVQSENDLLDGISVDGASGAENVFYVDGTDTSDLDQRDPQAGRRLRLRRGGPVQGLRLQRRIRRLGRRRRQRHHPLRRQRLPRRARRLLFGHGPRGPAARPAVLRPRRRHPGPLLPATTSTSARTRSTTYEVGFLLGGYLVKDKLWFFGAFTPAPLHTGPGPWTWPSRAARGVERLRPERDELERLLQDDRPAVLKNLRAGASFVMNLLQVQGRRRSHDLSADQTYAATSNATTDYNTLGYSYPNCSGQRLRRPDPQQQRPAQRPRRLLLLQPERPGLAPARLALLRVPPGAARRLRLRHEHRCSPRSRPSYVHPVGLAELPRAKVLGLDKRMAGPAELQRRLHLLPQPRRRARLQGRRPVHAPGRERQRAGPAARRLPGLGPGLHRLRHQLRPRHLRLLRRPRHRRRRPLRRATTTST
ncbi:MAG: hypothetical protein MZV64_49955 [Ignavibacteriales bacterium]|nr:hypothetical protein [Ignavibacteriales bacterium]